MISIAANPDQVKSRMSRLSLDIKFNEDQLAAAKDRRDNSAIQAYKENLEKLQEEQDLLYSKLAIYG